MGRIYGTPDKSEGHQKEIRESHQYKDYLKRHPKTAKILANHYPSNKSEKVGAKSKALSKAKK